MPKQVRHDRGELIRHPELVSGSHYFCMIKRARLCDAETVLLDVYVMFCYFMMYASNMEQFNISLFLIFLILFILKAPINKQVPHILKTGDGSAQPMLPPGHFYYNICLYRFQPLCKIFLSYGQRKKRQTMRCRNKFGMTEGFALFLHGKRARLCDAETSSA